MKKNLLSEEQVKKIAKLAGLTILDNEIEKFKKQLSNSLDYVAILNGLDTNKVLCTSQVTGKENVLREDETKPSFSQAEALSQAKEKQNGYFKVKNISQA